MVRLKSEKLRVKILLNESHILPRRYTLTHSDNTGNLYLTIAPDYDKEQISGLYTRFMRDEVLGEWKKSAEGYFLHIYCHIGGGLVYGDIKTRESIFRREMQLVLEAICNGDAELFQKNPELDNASIIVHYQKSGKDYKIEKFGKPTDYFKTK